MLTQERHPDLLTSWWVLILLGQDEFKAQSSKVASERCRLRGAENQKVSSLGLETEGGERKGLDGSLDPPRVGAGKIRCHGGVVFLSVPSVT